MKGLGDSLELKYLVKENDAERTVKSILENELGISQRMIKRLKHNAGIYVNSLPVYVVHRVRPGDIISVCMDFEDNCDDIVPENIKIDILYEDEYLIVLNKDPGMVVHPTVSHQTGTIANAIMHHLKQKGISIKIRPVNRLDRDTSGVIIFAKNPYVQNALAVQMSKRIFLKEYIGITWGVINKTSDTINLPIERKPNSIMLRHVSETGKPSITNYEILKRFEHATLLKFSLETGRTHQIRVHCHAINHPLIGDTLYWKWIPVLEHVMQKYNLYYNEEKPYDRDNTCNCGDIYNCGDNMCTYHITNKDYDTQNKDDNIICNTTENNPIDDYSLNKTDDYTFNKYKYVNSMFIQRQALHSYKVRFMHPVTNKEIEILAPLHTDMKKALEILENK